MCVEGPKRVGVHRYQRQSVMIDQAGIEHARRLGGGNISRGIRRALEAAIEQLDAPGREPVIRIEVEGATARVVELQASTEAGQ